MRPRHHRVRRGQLRAHRLAGGPENEIREGEDAFGEGVAKHGIQKHLDLNHW